MRGTWLILGLCSLLAAGCGPRHPPLADLKQSREALTMALDAWKDGKSIEALRYTAPPVDFRDLQWEKGARLGRYEIEKEERWGLSARFTVRLFAADRAGEGRGRVTVYNADAGPTIVIRPDF